MRYEDYADDGRAKTRFAAACSGLALVATVAAILLEIGLELRPSLGQRMQLVLTQDGAADVAVLCSCGLPPSDSISVEGLVASTDPRVQIKNIKLLTTTNTPAGRKALPPCVDDGIDVRVPRSEILVARNTDP